jgi:hypothetical protein
MIHGPWKVLDIRHLRECEALKWKNLQTPKRVAIVDCGTNTFTMVIVDLRIAWIGGVSASVSGVFWAEEVLPAASILPDRFAKGIGCLGHS